MGRRGRGRGARRNSGRRPAAATRTMQGSLQRIRSGQPTISRRVSSNPPPLRTVRTEQAVIRYCIYWKDMPTHVNGTGGAPGYPGMTAIAAVPSTPIFLDSDVLQACILAQLRGLDLDTTTNKYPASLCSASVGKVTVRGGPNIENVSLIHYSPGNEYPPVQSTDNASTMTRATVTLSPPMSYWVDLAPSSKWNVVGYGISARGENLVQSQLILSIDISISIMWYGVLKATPKAAGHLTPVPVGMRVNDVPASVSSTLASNAVSDRG